MKRILNPLVYLACLSALWTSSVSAEVSTPTEAILRRSLVSQGDTSRLKAVFEKARRGEPVTVAAIGGSITAGGRQTDDPANRYIQQVAKWFEAQFPKSKVTFVNAGIGGTNSFYGAMRLQRDVLARNPDLVIVEWAVNNLAGKDFAESYEGVLRQLLKAPGNIAVIELFFMHKDGENAQMWQEILGRHYGLPMVSFRDALFPEFTGGRVQWDDLYADVVHPKDAGHLLAGKLLVNLMESNLTGASAPVTSSKLPAPVVSDVYENCQFAIYEVVKPSANSGWERGADQKAWLSGETGSSIEFEFTGQALFLGYDFEKEQPAQAVYSIDGGKQQPLKEDAHRRPVASGLAKGVHKLRIEVQKAGAGKLKIWGVGGAEGPTSMATP
ncbi:MAG: GDSL-type esterase/lipase family protein [Verrucomicrobiota bacterium]